MSSILFTFVRGGIAKNLKLFSEFKTKEHMICKQTDKC